MMKYNVLEVKSLMSSVKEKYFPDLQEEITFSVIKNRKVEGAAGRIIFNSRPIRVILYYSDDKILEPRYRAGLIPIIAHELAHLVNCADPESILAKRLPTAMYEIWHLLLETGEAKCSMQGGGE